jgi:hypothetical protein
MTPVGRVTLSGAIFAGIAAIGIGAWRLLAGPDRPIKPIEPDALPQMPSSGKTGYKRIDAILPKLRDAANSSGIPLGLMVGWIAKESGGNLASKTSLGEVGLFQSMPDEDRTLGLDHDRVGTDLDYSIAAGVKLIRHYQSVVNDLNISGAPAGSAMYWKCVKMAHSMGSGQLKKVVKAAQAAGQDGSWDDLEHFALGMHINGPQPKKWFPFVDSVAAIGKPFGFGTESSASVGQAARFLSYEQLREVVGEENGFDMFGAEDA